MQICTEQTKGVKMSFPYLSKQASNKVYTVNVPPTWEQGSYTTRVRSTYYETYRQAALRDYNSCRAHDGLTPLKRMPRGTTYTEYK